VIYFFYFPKPKIDDILINLHPPIEIVISTLSYWREIGKSSPGHMAKSQITMEY